MGCKKELVEEFFQKGVAKNGRVHGTRKEGKTDAKAEEKGLETQKPKKDFG